MALRSGKVWSSCTVISAELIRRNSLSAISAIILCVMDVLERERPNSEIADLHNMNFSLMTPKSNKKMFHVFSISDLFVYFLKFFFQDFPMILDF